ncbi:DEAD/DEAH box helicase, partial [Mesorhizobium sp. M7A.F.Ca.ET.027.02.1.1]|uniref:DEAD/DEAH box helicase n=1 Tax=Mesorhizobium sp. M7A.F.Ca.ET.027.02.1.1 TaxID=2496655 RepID=UPI000FD20B8E
MSGNLLHPRLVEALTGKPGDDYRFNYPTYAHQIEAWRHLLAADSRSVLVSSGTGSGKTECFLIPLLNDLAREASLTGRLRGVRALMLYPLNALIASQEERLRRWIAPFGGQIRFALYNGLMADKRKSDREKAEKEYPEQVLYRATLRSDPPPVLVTNNTMLEYMTIRREDHPLLEASHGLLRWVVIDEAHSYVGSAAAEVSLLLRRVLQAFGVSAKQVRFVATSATLGGTDDKAKADLQRYLADLAGVPLSQVHVVFGARHKVALPPPTSAGRLTPEQLEPGGGFEKNPAVQELVRAAEKGAVSMAHAGQIAAGAGLDPVPLVEAIGAAALLPLRVHKFIRAIPGLWSCLNPDCDGERPEAWPFGALHFERSETCKICTAPVFELISCRECGEPFLNGYDHGDHLSPQAIAPDRDEFAVASARELDEPDDGEQDDDDTEAIKSVLRRDGDRRLIGTRLTDGLFERDVDPTSGALPEKRGEGRVLHLSRPVLDASCPCCRAAPSRRSGTVLWPFRFGAPFLIQNAAPTMLEGVKPSDRVNIELPAQGRQLLSFTDSRQGTARFAANIETMSERSYVRTFVYHLAQKAAAPQPLTREERTDLEAKRAKFAALVESDATFKPYLTEIEQQLSGRSANATVPWNDAVRDFSSEPMLKQWIGKVWDADRDDRFHRDPKALANYLILRELARRPRRANAIETLGLGKLVFPQIEKLTESRLPGPIKRQGYSLSVWRDFLYFLVDSVIRTNFVLNVSREDARWLLPRNAFLRGIVGPDQDRRIPSDVTWPKARAGGGIKTNAVLLLEKHLNLDSDSGEDRATINDILTQAWDQMRPLLEGSGSTFALGLDMAGIAAVDEAWLCPVTHRVLPRLVFGRTPYSVRHVSTGALQPVEAVRFPALPYFFPINDRERAALAEFVQSDPMIAALRQRGVWGNLHDRAATFAPYIRAEEHSAQQPPYRLREFEAQFKQGEINLLACSTTMEMGVDIGSVEAVLNTNVPPSIANYRQRVGRAGRRGQHFASSLTFARDTPLDRETFVDPIKYLGRELRSPQVKLDSRRIVQRHVNALLLAQWFRQAKGELMRVRAGQFFGCPEGVILAPDETPPVELFRNWLITPSTATVLSDRLTALTVGTAFQDNGSVLQIAADMFHHAAKAYRDQWDSLRQQAGAVVTEAKASLEMQIRRFCREPLLKELSTRSLLPGHGFPNAIVPFVNDCAETLNRQRLRSDEESETVRNRRYDYPSRNADVAIREYAPGAEVVVDGLVWTSAGVTLNWLRPAHDAGAREIQSIRWSWQCND